MFLNALKKLFNAKSQTFTDPVKNSFIAENGLIARFIFDKADLDSQGMPKRRAFKTENYQGRHELSICGLNGVSEDRMWFLGRTVRAKEGKSIYASIKLKTTLLTEFNLYARSEPQPPVFPEHGVILGWSDDKALRLSQETDVAAACSKNDVNYPAQ